MITIEKIHGREIIDSRGNPTIEAEVKLSDGSIGISSAPSGASTGSQEALELRDLDKNRYNGKGVLKSVKFINKNISEILVGQDPTNQKIIDKQLIDLDGTDNKSNLGANTILACSCAIAKAVAKSYNIPLYRYIGGMNASVMPKPMMNIINGGMHADNMLDLQEFMIAATGNFSFKESLRMIIEIYHNLKKILIENNYSTNVGDEGGFAPNLSSLVGALDFIMRAIENSGYKPGEDVSIAIDSAASEFYKDNLYHIKGENKSLTSDELIDYYAKLIEKYPIFSIEDAMAEKDFDGWKSITKILGQKIQLVGDDLIVTNASILKNMIDQNMANAVLIKPNQVGSLTETLDTINLAKKSGYKTIISHRSGETEDNFIAHLAVATNAGQIKAGAPCRTDRLVKYNELIRIEETL